MKRLERWFHADVRIHCLQDVSRIEPRYLLGIKSAEYSGTFVVNPHPTEGFARAPAGIHIVIPTVGAPLLSFKAACHVYQYSVHVCAVSHSLASPVQVANASSSYLSLWNLS